MARTKRSAQNRTNRALILAPILAGVLIFGVFILAEGPTLFPALFNGNPAMNYTVQISIQIEGTAQNGSRQLRFIFPQGVGEAGLPWYSHTYDANGVNGHYPLYIDPPQQGTYPGYSIIHVVSRVYHNYTLGDFFDVWGQTLGANNTVGVPSQGSSGNNWSMCVGPSVTSLRPGLWSREPLVNYNNIELVWDPIGCL